MKGVWIGALRNGSDTAQCKCLVPQAKRCGLEKGHCGALQHAVSQIMLRHVLTVPCCLARHRHDMAMQCPSTAFGACKYTVWDRSDRQIPGSCRCKLPYARMTPSPWAILDSH
mmetsp:Transcript_66722/g.111631  ORF Transcript_66722/g.111631 Transcript_66722/m.111631 type:complete len:113 (+) Transcript_66722:601-939(+)